MSLWQISLLAILQGFAELLPVSSSAHVILAQHLMGLDPSAPEMTFFLVMLHTGTMFAVLLYFFKRWKARLQDRKSSMALVRALLIATAATGILGLGLKILIEKVLLEKVLGFPKGEVEALFSVLPLVAFSLTVAGLLIIYSGRKRFRQEPETKAQKFPPTINLKTEKVSDKSALVLGLVQGLCLPLRGLSRSGATISTALLQGAPFQLAEDFSFALAVLLTPPVVFLELRRLLKAQIESAQIISLITPGLIGMGLSFLSGLLALRWLSAWLEGGRWQRFGFYCLALAVVTMLVHVYTHSN